MQPHLIILSQYYPPETGAPQTRLSELAEGLRRRGWEVSIVTALPNYPHGKIAAAYRGKWRVIENQDGITVRRYWLYASNSTKAWPRILSMLSFSMAAFCALPHLWRFRPDYLLVESPPLTLGLSGWFLSRLSGSKFIFNISDLWPLTAKELGAIRDGWLYRRLEGLERFLYRQAFACTGQSEEIVQHIRQRGGRRVWLFRNGVNLARFESESVPAGRNDGVSIVYTGLLGVAQGMVQLCRNIDFKRLGVSLHIYGAGPEQEQLMAFLHKNPDRGIYYHGLAASGKIPGILQKHDAALVSLVRHIPGAVPSKMYEALAAGLPVFFSGEGEGAKLIKKHGAGWVSHPENWAGLREQIAAFAATRPALAAHCRSVVARFFNRENEIERLERLLREHLHP
ncbi:MAG: glycosyltransferase family 4 protein [Saprospiraceae bacterium]|nr:glycosyltransferase family 4 protein [Saprospiraceae bacterium]